MLPSSAYSQTVKTSPRLIINIAIDQLRTDYLESFAPLYGQEGFKKLLQDGMVFENASYPFAPVDRSSAIATIASGTSPYYHGVVGNMWLNRESLRPTYSDDGTPNQITTSTIGDEMKVATAGASKVFSIAPSRDAAIFSGGHAADGAFWINDLSGEWNTSAYYVRSVPEWVLQFNKNHPNTLKGYKEIKKHKESGAINQNVEDMALACIENNQLGQDDITDLLNITYYAGNPTHSNVTTWQSELQQTYVSLDNILADFIRKTQEKVGSDRVMFVITSTGYSNEETLEDNSRYRIPSGTFYLNRTANLLNMYYGALYESSDKYVETCFRNQIFLNHKLLEQKKISLADALSRAEEFLMLVDGVREVYTSQRLFTEHNPKIEKRRNGFNIDRCGDILIEVTPGWKLVNEDNNLSEISRLGYFQFPVIFYGGGVKAGRVTTPVSVDQIAPTITKSIRIRAPNACSAQPLF